MYVFVLKVESREESAESQDAPTIEPPLPVATASEDSIPAIPETPRQQSKFTELTETPNRISNYRWFFSNRQNINPRTLIN